MKKSLLKRFDGKRIVVTGGTGSFGETLATLFLEKSRAREIVVYSRDEQKHVLLHRRHPGRRLVSILGDVRNLERLRLALRGADFVINAAAIKHVHFTEEHPIEAVYTNVLGAYNVCQAALECGVQALVTLSTDKAVMPVNAMGMTKALQERVVASFAGKGMRLGIVRYGNVLNSNGSVIPYFKQLLESGAKELPVTDKRMTRFVLTLKESVDLVLYALQNCQEGETFVLDLPMFRIWDVAEVMVQAVRRKVKIREVGIRPGEKLHETLVSFEEARRASHHGNFWMIRRYHSGDELFKASMREISLTSDRARSLNKNAIRSLLERERCLPRS